MNNEPTLEKTFSKSEAIALMRQGKKLTHRYFSSDEWVTSNETGTHYTLEDGVTCSASEFWSLRTLSQWQGDWRLYTPEHPEEAGEVKEDIEQMAITELDTHYIGGNYASNRIKEGNYADGWERSIKMFVSGYKKGSESTLKVAEAALQTRTEYPRLMRLLESLTPSGSEFVNNPEGCAAWIKEQIQGIPKAILPFKKRAEEATSLNEAFANLLHRIVGSMSLERAERFDLNAEAIQLLKKSKL